MKIKNPCNEIFLDIESGGFKKGEMMIISTGRQTGKTTFYQYADQWADMIKAVSEYSVVDKSLVDGDKWYTVKCSKDVASWVREHSENGWWKEHIDGGWYVHRTTFDMHEKLYTLLQLKWS